MVENIEKEIKDEKTGEVNKSALISAIAGIASLVMGCGPQYQSTPSSSSGSNTTGPGSDLGQYGDNCNYDVDCASPLVCSPSKQCVYNNNSNSAIAVYDLEENVVYIYPMEDTPDGKRIIGSGEQCTPEGILESHPIAGAIANREGMNEVNIEEGLDLCFESVNDYTSETAVLERPVGRGDLSLDMSK